MKTTKDWKTSYKEQEVLNGVTVRLIDGKEEQERFSQLLIKHHYLHSADMFGERLCYVAPPVSEIVTPEHGIITLHG